MARFRLGNESRTCNYWQKAKEKTCRVCGREEETIVYIFKVCEASKYKKNLPEILSKEGGERGFVKAALWKRKRKEERERSETDRTRKERASHTSTVDLSLCVEILEKRT